MERLGLFFNGRSGAATFGLLEKTDKVGGKNGATGTRDIEGKAAMGSGERAGTQASFNRATGRSDIEGSEPDWH